MNTEKSINEEKGNAVLPLVSKRAWLFHCTNKIRTYKLYVYIEDSDRESAIAQFEGINHDLEWWQTTEIQPVC